jgi:hypothetical protein
MSPAWPLQPERALESGSEQTAAKAGALASGSQFQARRGTWAGPGRELGTPGVTRAPSIGVRELSERKCH